MDGFGIQGMVFHFAVVFTLVGTAMILFFYCWWKGRLDMDEEPKLQMLEDEKK